MTGNRVWIMGIVLAIGISLTIAWAGSISGQNILGMPLLLLLGVLAFVIQWVAFVPAFVGQTEKYFDLIGSFTYVSLALIGLYFAGPGWGAVLVSCMVLVWALRLGLFLFKRVRNAGHDRRFASIKPDFLQFLMTWTIQGMWVFVTFGAGLAALSSGRPYPIDGFVLVGALIWAFGMIIEVIADDQKTRFNKDPNNSGRFITTGLWAWSRHPNYFGEITLWVGIAVAAYPVLIGWQYITLISPLFVIVLLTKISGVRMLEARARKKWGDEEGYKKYCRQTPALLLNPMLKPVTGASAIGKA